MDEVEHIIVEGEAEEPSPGEEVVAAAAAVALAEAGAAAAELDAAERMRRLETENEEWRRELSLELSGVSASLRALREQELSELETHRLALAASFQSLEARQEAMEAQFQSLIPSQSEVQEAETTAEVMPGPELGTEAEVEAGPVSLDASLEAGGNSPNSEANRVRKRRWI